ncbi:MAG: hypothetical protein HC930_08105 [Hydrococcus sp. SU_1_0]|nr:hypothetical protein [Hydrococcus sp. SU_1_0]
MNKVVLLTLIGTLALVTGGCSFFSNFADSQQELREETAQSTPVEAGTTQAQLQTTQEDFADLELEQLKTQSLPEIAGLIPATNPDDRARTSIRGRNDPFSGVALNPHIKIKEDENKPAPKVAEKPSNVIASRDYNTQDRYSDRYQDVSAPPAAPDTNLAMNVVVSGIYQANGRTKLIVKAPEESSSRYVEVGDYLSNNQVLVKRVDDSQVILEQSGEEVTKTIGEAMTDGNSISALPPAPSSNWGNAISLR